MDFLALLKPFVSLPAIQSLARWLNPFKVSAVFQETENPQGYIRPFVLVSIVNKTATDVTIDGAGFQWMVRSWRTLWFTRPLRKDPERSRTISTMSDVYRAGEQRKKSKLPYRFLARERVMIEIPFEGFPARIEHGGVNGVWFSTQDGRVIRLLCPEVVNKYMERQKFAREQQEKLHALRKEGFPFF